MRGKQSSYICVSRGAQFGIVDERGIRRIRTFHRFNGNHSMRDRDSFSVPKGSVVPFSFAPYDDNAKKDRQDQLKNPVKFCETEQDRQFIAELLWKDGEFRNKTAALAYLDKELGNKSTKLPKSTPELTSQNYIDAISDAYGKDELRDILDTNQIAYFKGAKEATLAKKLFEHGLQDEIRVKKHIRV